MIDRRVEHRLLCADLVDVQWKDPSGRVRHGVANLEDISISGHRQLPLRPKFTVVMPAAIIITARPSP